MDFREWDLQEIVFIIRCRITYCYNVLCFFFSIFIFTMQDQIDTGQITKYKLPTIIAKYY